MQLLLGIFRTILACPSEICTSCILTRHKKAVIIVYQLQIIISDIYLIKDKNLMIFIEKKNKNSTVTVVVFHISYFMYQYIYYGSFISMHLPDWQYQFEFPLTEKPMFCLLQITKIWWIFGEEELHIKPIRSCRIIIQIG